MDAFLEKPRGHFVFERFRFYLESFSDLGDGQILFHDSGTGKKGIISSSSTFGIWQVLGIKSLLIYSTCKRVPQFVSAARFRWTSEVCAQFRCERKTSRVVINPFDRHAHQFCLRLDVDPLVSLQIAASDGIDFLVRAAPPHTT